MAIRLIGFVCVALLAACGAAPKAATPVPQQEAPATATTHYDVIEPLLQKAEALSKEMEGFVFREVSPGVVIWSDYATIAEAQRYAAVVSPVIEEAREIANPNEALVKRLVPLLKRAALLRELLKNEDRGRPVEARMARVNYDTLKREALAKIELLTGFAQMAAPLPKDRYDVEIAGAYTRALYARKNTAALNEWLETYQETKELQQEIALQAARCNVTDTSPQLNDVFKSGSEWALLEYELKKYVKDLTENP